MSIRDMENIVISKEKEVKFIEGFKNIKFYNICKEENVNPQNYYKLEVSPEKLLNIKANIDNKIKKLYEDYNGKDNSL